MGPTHGSALALVLALALALAPRVASANAAAPYSKPLGVLPGPVMLRPSPVVVEREELDVDCAKEGDSECTFTATYFLRNPTPQPEELLGAFYSIERQRERGGSVRDDSERLRVELDGRDVAAQASSEQLQTMDAIVRADPEVTQVLDRRGLGLERQPFVAQVMAAGTARLVFRGPFRPITYTSKSPREGYAIPAYRTRHVALGSTRAPWDSYEQTFLYLITPLRGWAGDPEVLITVRYPSSNDFVPTSPSTMRWSSEESGTTRIARTTVRASSAENLRFELKRSVFPLVHGGPVLGIGPRIGRKELRIRGGYEVGLYDSLVLGVMADTNFKDYATVAATLDIATPSFVYIIPSLALGLGVPVQWRTAEPTRVGVRGQLSVNWGLIGLSFPVDVYPVANSSGSHVEGSFLTTLSF